MLPLPAWRERRTQPIDIRDTVSSSTRPISAPSAAGRSLDIAGPDVLTYGEMIQRIRRRDALGRPRCGLPLSVTRDRQPRGRRIAGEDPELIGPLMEGLGPISCRATWGGPRSSACACTPSTPRWSARCATGRRSSRSAARRRRPPRYRDVAHGSRHHHHPHRRPAREGVGRRGSPRPPGDWVTIHRKLGEVSDRPLRKGSTLEQAFSLRGAHFKVHWTVTELEHSRRVAWEGEGPVRSTRLHQLPALSRQRRDALRLRERLLHPRRAAGRRRRPRAGRRHLPGEAEKTLKKLKSLVDVERP